MSKDPNKLSSYSLPSLSSLKNEKNLSSLVTPSSNMSVRIKSPTQCELCGSEEQDWYCPTTCGMLGSSCCTTLLNTNKCKYNKTCVYRYNKTIRSK